MSAYGGKADSLAHLSVCPLIAKSGHSRSIKRHHTLAPRCRGWEPSTASNSHVLLSSAQQIQILRLLVERIDVAPDGIDVRLCTGGIDSIVSELISEGGDEPAASAEALTEEAAA